jgi:hypothetical protein
LLIASWVMKVVYRVAHPGGFCYSPKGYSKEGICTFKVGTAAFVL